jgi:hypothetical protein
LGGAEARLLAAQTRKAELLAAPIVSSNPIEDDIQSRTAPTATWMRSHMDVVANPVRRQQLADVHDRLVQEGIQPDTPRYFSEVEARMGIKSGRNSMQDVNPADPRTHLRGDSVYLTPGERKAATDGTLTHTYDDPNGRFKRGDVLGVQEFSRRKREMLRQGHWYDKLG